ncbi:MAG: sigma-54-dependent Fis family transcriptional regulator [Myxococcales bacterium]|nr:MAG: sigma-54-dependent Fis family transcriptional regulator [Myxococcales bacterium]
MASARVLVVDDDPAIRKIIADRMRAQGHEVELAVDGDAALQAVADFEPGLVLLDMKMPKKDGFEVLEALRRIEYPPDVVMITAHGNIERAVRAIQMGAADFIPKPFEAAHLDHVVSRVLEAAGLRQRVLVLQSQLSDRHTLVRGASKAMKDALALADRAAASNATVLLLGESGTGKEVMARHIHSRSPRADGAFVALNCAMLSGDLLESELFGHEKGAFTGAHKAKPGSIEQAEGGTLFLDEVGELGSGAQAKLLRVLQERQFLRVGGTKVLDADIRIVAATNRDLRKEAEDGSFREDLYYRLNVVSIRLPPLRERPEDLRPLAEHALARFTAELGRAPLNISDEAWTLLLEYPWPGNVRELNNVIERAAVLAPEDRIDVDDLPEELRELETQPDADVSTIRPIPPDDPEIRPYRDAVLEAKRTIIRRALERTGGHQTKAAELLGVRQPYLARLIKNLGVPKS